MRQSERLSVPFFTKLILFIVSIIAFGFNIFLLLLITGGIVLSNSTILKHIYLASLIIALIYTLFIIRRPINTNYKLTWCILLILFPLPFSILYTFNYFSRIFSKKKRLKIQKKVSISSFTDDLENLKNFDALGGNIVSAVQKSTFSPVYKKSSFKYFGDIAVKFQDLLEETKKAEHYIFIEYFTISAGALWDELYPILMDRGQNGVEIKILYDDVGSKLGMRKRLIKNLLKIPNLKVDTYEKVGETSSFLLNYRDHRKIFIIDGKIAYCGGDNLADEYIHKKERFGYWRDSCGKYEGLIVHTFVQMFREMWYISTDEYIPDDIYLPNYEIENKGYYMAFSDGPLYVGNPGYDLFMMLISSATNYIYISTPYFIIDDALLTMIALKAKSGVDVKILMPGIPDKRAPYYMGRGLYGEIIKCGGKIFEYIPGFNHSKTIIVDGKYAYIGTINFDYRSLFLHYECGALIMYDDEIKNMELDYNNAISQSELITYRKWKKLPWYQRLWAFMISIFNPMF